MNQFDESDQAGLLNSIGFYNNPPPGFEINKSILDNAKSLESYGIGWLDLETNEFTLIKYKKDMTLNEYQQQALATAVYPKSALQNNVVYPALGLVGEAGEIANKVKKIIRDDDNILTQERMNDLISELGDVLWYAAALATELDCSLEEVAQENLEKLAKRKQKNTLHGAGDNR
jgi:NTP pyrophosphatase (non-canonical NTP hydrolase)